ncbi:MAG: AAA family ATPase, partial [Patescibacteria group bacterium]
MRLQSLKLSGFKSFARTTVFDFPSEISAIVGPNGSGKSNVAEAIRWALGEQSLKTIRTRRGEDLIFNGSPKVPRMGKAAVTLTFDNSDGTLPLDFGKAILERKIFRDGVNEYYLNGSQVRLKDIVELLAKIGLGETKHNIIGQGEVDRILGASPEERREILEEAIGLRLYQLKKREAERKLEETHTNIGQVRLLVKEITPHLKFLKSQADKAEKREVIAQELKSYYRAYVQKEEAELDAESRRLDEEAGPATAKLKVLEKEIAGLGRRMEDDKPSASEAAILAEKESELARLEIERRELERELGRIEGRLESAPISAPSEVRKIEISLVEKYIRPIREALRQALRLDSITLLKQQLEETISNLGLFLDDLLHSKTQAASGQNLDDRLRQEQKRLQARLTELDSSLAASRQDL